MRLGISVDITVSSLCNLCVLCVSVVIGKQRNHRDTENTEVSQRRRSDAVNVSSSHQFDLTIRGSQPQCAVGLDAGSGSLPNVISVTHLDQLSDCIRRTVGPCVNNLSRLS